MTGHNTLSIELIKPTESKPEQAIVTVSKVIVEYLFFVSYKTVHSPLFFRKIVEIENFALRSAILVPYVPRGAGVEV